MFEKLKEMLPESLRKKLGLANATEEESQEHSDESEENSHDSETKSTAPDANKNRISMIIRVVVVLGLGYLAIDQFVLKPSEEEVIAVPVKPRKSRKKPPVPADVVAPTNVAEVKDEKKSEEKKEEVSLDPVPAENINIADKKNEEQAIINSEPIKEEKAEAIVETKVEPKVENNVEPKVETKAEPKVEVEEKVANKPPKIQAEAASPPAIPGLDKEEDINAKIDTLIEKSEQSETSANTNAEKKPKKKMNLEDAIVDSVYIAPPAYDQLGRGLVYNCKEKFWACIDKASYVICNKNMKFNAANAKEKECVVQNVYNSEEDCGVIQKFNVSSNKATSFCK